MNYLRYLILALAAAIMTRPVHAQTKVISLKGAVTDSLTGVVLEQASILLLRLPGERTISQAISGKNGFVLRRIPPGNYLLISSFIGYKRDSLSLTVSDRDSSALILPIRMQPAGTDLMEVVVRTTIPPMTIRHDTLVYNANAYKTRPNATIEDFLKKLPGVEVDKNGNITVQGKSVEKIYIDGKAFFLSDPRILTQNLTADMVEQVEAMDAHSDRAKLTGVPDANPGKALNVKLKKGKKPGFLGNVQGGYGTEETRSAEGQVMRMQQDPWVFANFKANSNALSGSTNGNLNYSGKLGSKITATINYAGNQSRSDQSQNSFQETFLGDSTLTQRSSLQSNTKDAGNTSFASLIWNIDSFNSVTLSPMVNNNTAASASSDTQAVVAGKATGNYTSSRGVTNNTASSKGYSLNNGLSFSHRFRKTGRTFFAGLSGGYNRQQQDAALYSVLDSYDSINGVIKNSTVNQQSTQNTGMHSYGLNLTYTEPISARQVLDFSYMVNYAGNSTDKYSYDYNPVTRRYDLPDSLTTNNFTNTSTTQRLDIGYDVNSGKLHYQLGTGAIDQLQPLPDLSNPFLVKIGNPNLYPQFTHAADIGYQSFNTEHFTTFLAQAGANYILNKITSSTTVARSGIQQIQYINVNGAYSFNGNLTFGFPLGGLKSGNGKINSSAMYNRDISFVNGAQNNTSGIGFTQDLSLNFNYRDKLFVEGKSGISYNAIQYSIQQGANTKIVTQQYDFDISYELPLALRLATDCHWQITGPQGNLPGNQQVLWNASLSKKIFRNRQGELKLSGMDLLNTSSGYSQNSSANSIQTTTTKIVGRVFQAGFLYRFKK